MPRIINPYKGSNRILKNKNPNTGAMAAISQRFTFKKVEGILSSAVHAKIQMPKKARIKNIASRLHLIAEAACFSIFLPFI